MIFFLSPIFFFLGNNICLRATTDMNHVTTAEYKYWDVMWYNFALWTVAHIIGLNFTHYDEAKGLKYFSLSPEFIS